MRVAIVHPRLSRRGGIERYVYELSGRLARDHEVTLVIGTQEVPEPPGCRVAKLPYLPRPLWLSAVTFSVASWLFLRGRSFDLVNAHGASSFVQDVVTAHSCHRAWFRGSRAALARMSARWWLKVLNPLHYFAILIESVQYRPGGCRRVISVSTSVKRELGEQYGVPADRVVVIHSGVDLDEFHPSRRGGSRAEIRARHGIADGDLALLFLGNEFRRKGLETLLEALARDDLAEAKLFVAGADDPEPYRRLAGRLGLEGRVAFLGPTGEAARLYGAADVFVLPTRYEAFPLVVLEAMASGLPVVTTRTAGASELIEDGVDGVFLEDPSDAGALAACIRTLRSAEERRAMGGRARRRVEALSWERVAEETVAVFETARGPGGAPPLG